MPFREYTPDTGFNTFSPDTPTLTPPEPNLLEQAGKVASVLTTLMAPTLYIGRNLTGWEAAFHLSNSVLNGVEALTQPTFPPDPNFNILKTMKDNGVDPDFQAPYAGIQSEAEFNFVHQKILRDEDRQRTLASYGAAGQLMSLVAGAVDPTMLLPLVGEWKGLSSVVRAGAMGALGAGLSEIPMRANQPERTNADTMGSITMGALLGAVLGGATGYIHGKGTIQEQLNELGRSVTKEMGGPLPAEQEPGMASTHGGQAIPNAEIPAGIKFEHWFANSEPGAEIEAGGQKYTLAENADGERTVKLGDQVVFDPNEGHTLAELPPELTAKIGASPLVDGEALPVTDQLKAAQAAGADVARPPADAGGLAPAYVGIGPLRFDSSAFWAQSGPVLRVLSQKGNGTLRWIMSQLSDAGTLRENRDIPSSEGGTAESRSNYWMGAVANYTRELDRAHHEYLWGEGNEPKFAANTKALYKTTTTKDLLSKDQFRDEIGWAMGHNDQHDIPQVANMAKYAREKVLKPLHDEATRLKLFQNPEQNTNGDESYFSHNYNTTMINHRLIEFQRILGTHIDEKLQAQFQEAFNALKQKQLKSQTQLGDLTRPADEVAKLKEEFTNDLQAINESTRGTGLDDLEVQITNLRSQARTKGISRSAKDSLLEQARTLEEQGGNKLTAVRAQRAELRGRLNSLNKSEAVYGSRQQAKLDLITELEDRNLRTVGRVAKTGQKLLNELDGLSDKELNARVSELQDQLHEAGLAMDAGQARLSKAYEKADFANEEDVTAVKGKAQLSRQNKFERWQQSLFGYRLSSKPKTNV